MQFMHVIISFDNERKLLTKEGEARPPPQIRNQEKAKQK